jgi:hypothetical protein
MTADPWALLREAKDLLAENVCGCLKPACLGFRNRLAVARIDAALAAHDAAPARAMPEWTVWKRLWYDAIVWKIRDFRQGVTLSVKPSRPTNGFYWSVKQFGQKPTEDEAKAAAVECAKRLP